jgi:putative flippase GtrA
LNDIFAQLGKFGLVGILNTLLDIVLFNVIRKFTKIKTIWASYISSTVAMINSYILNRLWTFKSAQTGEGQLSEAAKFFFVTVIGVYVIHNGIVWLLSEKFTWPSKVIYSIYKRIPVIGKIFSEKFVYDNVAKVAGIAFSMIWNFVFYKFFVFTS